MALFPIHNYFVFNGDIQPVSEFVVSENEGGIYEVLRVCDGVPLFLHDHLERFYKSAQIAGKSVVYNSEQIKLFLKLLIEKNEITFGNILISCKINLKAFFIAHKYPLDKDYKEGVKSGILKAERENPNAKVFQNSVRLQANELIEQNNLYEVLLVDNTDRITEGSRSNVFFIKGNQLVTPCATNVLLGITRQKTILCAEKLGVEVVETDIFLKDIHSFEAAFITGTSPKILPLKTVGAIVFNPQNLILQSLISQYDQLIEASIKTA